MIIRLSFLFFYYCITMAVMTKFCLQKSLWQWLCFMARVSFNYLETSQPIFSYVLHMPRFFFTQFCCLAHCKLKLSLLSSIMYACLNFELAFYAFMDRSIWMILKQQQKKISSVFFDEYFVKFGTVSNNIGILSSNHACFDKKKPTR